jgi:hypothetical protein
MFDPGGATGLPTARWSPLAATTTSTGALRTGRALAQAIPRAGVTNAEVVARRGQPAVRVEATGQRFDTYLIGLDDANPAAQAIETARTHMEEHR